MKQFNVICPQCGTVNKGLYLEETDGWMECEKCHSLTQSKRFASRNQAKVLLYHGKTDNTLAKQPAC